MNTINTFRQSINLFRASFAGLSPFLLVGMCSTWLLMLAINRDPETSSFEWMSLILIYSIGFVMHTCLMIGAYYQYQQRRFGLTEIVQQAIIKTPQIFLLIIFFLLPLGLVLSIHFIPDLFFGEPESANVLLENDNSTMAYFMSGTLGLIVVIASGVSLYWLLVYGYVAGFGIAVKNLSLRESLRRSKVLVKNHKWFIFRALFILSLGWKLIDIMVVHLLGETSAAMLTWLIYAPLNACFIVIVYDALENILKKE